MTSRNLAIVWAPNILRSLHQDMVSEESLRDIGVQAKVVECFIDNYKELFSGRDNSAIADDSVVRYQSMKENIGRERKNDDKYTFDERSLVFYHPAFSWHGTFSLKKKTVFNLKYNKTTLMALQSEQVWTC